MDAVVQFALSHSEKLQEELFKWDYFKLLFGLVTLIN
jgi:hypothetical protein